MIPFVDRVAYKHDLREIRSTCRARSAHQGQHAAAGRRHFYFQVTDPSSHRTGPQLQVAITQLAQTTLRSVIGRMELDRTFEERDHINGLVVAALDQAAELGRQGAALRDQGPDAAEGNLHAMQAQITAEREKRAVIATSRASSRSRSISRTARAPQRSPSPKARSRRDQPGAGPRGSDSRHRQGECAGHPPGRRSDQCAGGINAVNLKVAELYIAAFSNLAKAGNTLMVPSNLADVATLSPR